MSHSLAPGPRQRIRTNSLIAWMLALVAAGRAVGEGVVGRSVGRFGRLRHSGRRVGWALFPALALIIVLTPIPAAAVVHNVQAASSATPCLVHLTDQATPTSAVSISPNGVFAVAAIEGGPIRVWRLDYDQALVQTKTPTASFDVGPVDAIAVSDAGLVATGDGSSVVVWSLTGAELENIAVDVGPALDDAPRFEFDRGERLMFSSRALTHPTTGTSLARLWQWSQGSGVEALAIDVATTDRLFIDVSESGATVLFEETIPGPTRGLFRLTSEGIDQLDGREFIRAQLVGEGSYLYTTRTPFSERNMNLRLLDDSASGLWARAGSLVTRAGNFEIASRGNRIRIRNGSNGSILEPSPEVPITFLPRAGQPLSRGVTNDAGRPLVLISRISNRGVSMLDLDQGTCAEINAETSSIWGSPYRTIQQPVATPLLRTGVIFRDDGTVEDRERFANRYGNNTQFYAAPDQLGNAYPFALGYGSGSPSGYHANGTSPLYSWRDATTQRFYLQNSGRFNNRPRLDDDIQSSADGRYVLIASRGGSTVYDTVAGLAIKLDPPTGMTVRSGRVSTDGAVVLLSGTAADSSALNVLYLSTGDIDSDGIPNYAEGSSIEDGGLPEFQNDQDLDGVADPIDNCPLVANTNQADDDQDGIGDECGADAGLRVAIIGDSYIAGEGTGTFIEGTDTSENKCHRSTQSWAYQAALDLTGGRADRITFLACSGAVTENLLGIPQYSNEGGSQIARLNAADIPEDRFDVVLLSIGGNDAQFPDIIRNCVLGNDCRPQVAAKAARIDGSVRPAIYNTIRSVQTAAPEARIFQMGYPSPLRPDQPTCASLGIPYEAWYPDVVPIFDAGPYTVIGVERRAIDTTFIPTLNSAVRDATTQAGAVYIDVEDTFFNNGLCSEFSFANGLRPGNDVGLPVVGGLEADSFHPTEAGYDAMHAAFRAQAMPDGDIELGPVEPQSLDPQQPASRPIATLTSPVDTAVTKLSWGERLGGFFISGPPGIPLFFRFNSNPLDAGSLTIPESGSIELDVNVPVSLPPGPHRFSIVDDTNDTLLSVLVNVAVPDGCIPIEAGDDADGDGIAQQCDVYPDDGPNADADGDGILNGADNCPLVPNSAQALSDPELTIGSACAPGTPGGEVRLTAVFEIIDFDSDGIPDQPDNCPTIENRDQADSDGDGVGDVCEGDVAAPVVTGSVAPTPNEAGWINVEATIKWAASDPAPSAGLLEADPAATIANIEGTNTYTSAEVCDVLNQCAPGKLDVSIDVSDPDISIVGVADGTSILIADYTPPTCTASDTVSGVAGECSVQIADPIETPGTLVYTATATASDVAGNTAIATATYYVIIDTDAPTIMATPDRAANAAGWWSGPVTFTFTCDDATSTVASCPGPMVVNTDGASQSFTVRASDTVGNQGTLVVGGINVDSVAPEVVVSGLTAYTVADQVVIDCAANDALSTIASESCDPIDVTAVDFGVGTQTVTFSAADVAGNTTVEQVSITVTVTQTSLLDVAFGYLDGQQGLIKSLEQSLKQGSLSTFTSKLNAQCCNNGPGSRQSKRLSGEERATLIALASELFG